MERKPSTLPKAPPVPEEPLDKMPRGELVCEICNRTFKTHSQLDHHREQMHGTPEKTHSKPHSA